MRVSKPDSFAEQATFPFVVRYKPRLIAAFDFHRQIVFVKFIGTHAEYDAVDALTVAQF